VSPVCWEDKESIDKSYRNDDLGGDSGCHVFRKKEAESTNNDRMFKDRLGKVTSAVEFGR
jgi:hypothetical protein